MRLRVPALILLVWVAGGLCLIDSHRVLHYVRPTEQDATVCPDDAPCKPLDYYLKNTSLYFTDNTTLIFLKGTHKLNTSLSIQSVTNLLLIGHGATIVCNATYGVYFINTSGLVIQQIAFINCGSGKRSPWKPWARFNNMMLCDVSAALCIANSQNIIINQVSVENSTGYGLLAVNVFGHSIIQNSAFRFNNYRTLQSGYHNNTNPHGGNAFVLYTNCGCNDRKEVRQARLSIANCSFSHGVDLSRQPLSQLGSGLTVIAASAKYSANISIQNVSSTANTALRGANMYLAITAGNTTISLNNSLSSLGNVNLPPVTSPDEPLPLGAGLYHHYRVHGLQPLTTTAKTSVLEIFQCLFKDNHGPNSALHFDLFPQQSHNSSEHHVGLYDTVITRSAGLLSITLPHTRLPEYSPNPNVIPITITIQNSVFSHSVLYNVQAETPPNAMLSSLGNGHSRAAVALMFLKQTPVIIANCTFENNVGTALSILDSKIRFQDVVAFNRNMGVDGGAMALYGESVLSILPNTNIRFHSNHAVRGGAIYVESTMSEFVSPMCFFRIVPTESRYTDNVTVLCVNNTAIEAGNVVYGGNIKSCPSFDTIFHIRQTAASDEFNTERTSAVSSDPEQVCLCTAEDRPDCGLEQRVQVYPGGILQVPAALVGERESVVSGTIHGEFSPCQGETNNLDANTNLKFQTNQIVRNKCTTLTYTVLSHNHCIELALKPELSKNSNQLFSPSASKITIHLLPCPLGFQLSDEGYCSCNALLERYKVVCIIDTQAVLREPPLWIGNDNGIVAISESCFGDYCRSDGVRMALRDDELQCTTGRHGILCGACEPGLSLTLGGNHCVQCSNTNLYLLVVFALVGVVGVVLLAALNLTVATGTINGLLLYANIVQVNYITFFPPYSDVPQPRLKQFFTLLLSWPNLDAGIETCFYSGMTAAAKAWLQLVFPVYFSALGGLFYLICQCTALKKRLGKLSTAVFATTLLLSLTKILRTITTYLAYAILHYQDGRHRMVWFYDGNLDYYHGKHSGLFVAAILLFILLVLPFTVLLLLAPCLRGLAKRHCRTCGEQASLLRAYLAPFRVIPPVTGCWMGIVQVIRIILFATSIITPHQQSETSLRIILTAIFCLLALAWRLGEVYNSSFVGLTEALFILNLGLLSAWSLLDSNSDPSTSEQYTITYILVGMATATAGAVLCYLLGLRVIQLVRWAKGSNIAETPLTDAPPTNQAQLPLITAEGLMESDYTEMAPLVLGACTASTKSHDI